MTCFTFQMCCAGTNRAFHRSCAFPNIVRLAHYTRNQHSTKATARFFIDAIPVISCAPIDEIASLLTTFAMNANFNSPFTVRAPATSANMGPGFDCIGIALDLWNITHVTPGHGDSRIDGEGSEILPTDSSNLIFTSANATFAIMRRDPLPFYVECENSIPCARGIGSSSAAVATGVAIAMHAYGEDINDHGTKLAMLDIAAEIEAHPDNVAPAIFGACQIGYKTTSSNGRYAWRSQRVAVADELRAVLFVPDLLTLTDHARGLLADEVQRSDAVFNISRASLLTYALVTGEHRLLRHATEDRLHQPQRIAELFPKFNIIARAAMDAGALGVFLSGAGPTVLALATDRHMTISYEMAEAARKASVEGHPMVTSLTATGIEVLD